jgi:hypothetical protein
MRTKKKKFKQIVVRGCVMKVLAESSKALEDAERILNQKDWNKNQVD